MRSLKRQRNKCEMSNSGKKASNDDDDEVEQLLRAAHDDVLLKLSVNSHTAAIDSDLDRRFQALKNPQNLIKKQPEAEANDDDLFTRFTALKNSLPSNSSSNFMRDGDAKAEDEDEDEVEKVIRWATDAARLDPSPPSEDDDSSDDDDHRVGKGKKSKTK